MDTPSAGCGSLDALISIYPSGNQPVASGMIPIRDYFSTRWQQEVSNARKHLNGAGSDSPEWRRHKLALPAVCLSGIAKRRSTSGFTSHSGWLQIDIDPKHNPQITDWGEAKEAVFADPHVGAVQLSASGTGIKAILRIDQNFHSASVAAAADYFEAMYGLTIDPACKDPARLAFVSFDPQPLIKDDTAGTAVVTLPLPENAVEGYWSTPALHSGAVVPEIVCEDAEIERRVGVVREMLSFIPTRPDEPIWFEVISGVGSYLPYDEAAEALIEWSPEEQEGEYEQRLKRRLSAIGIGTVIRMAEEGGYDPSAFDARRVDQLWSGEGVVSAEGGGGLEDLGAEEQPTDGQQAGQQEILRFPEDIHFSSEVDALVKGLLDRGGMSVIYGASNVGKTFWMMDLSACVATRPAWRAGVDGPQGKGLTVHGGGVLYFALEGSRGSQRRILAMREAGILKHGDDFALCSVPLNLLHPAGYKEIVRVIKEYKRRRGHCPALIVIDTLNRAFGGGNESASEDMGAVLAACDKVRAISKAHIAVVHHSGKDELKGSRGHSSLRCATDTEIELWREEGSEVITVEVKKQRDIEYHEVMPFKLKTVTLGVDDDGDVVTSCVCEQLPGSESVSKTVKVKRDKVMSQSNKEMEQMREIMDLLPVDGVADWQAAAAAIGVPRASFFRRKKLVEAFSYVFTSETGKVERSQNWISTFDTNFC